MNSISDTSLASIAVIGAGLMGHGIAQIFAAAGHPVSLFDTSADALAAAKDRMGAICDLLGQDKALLARVTFEPDFAAAVGAADFVFEAGPERLPIKQDIFSRLEAAAKPDAVLATNTSAIPIRDVGAPVASKHRVVGAHFWNPPHLVPLVEVVQAEGTSLEVVERTIALLDGVGMSPVHVKRDIPGFIGNRLQHALKREAIALVANGVCDAETVDRVTKEGFGARLAVMGTLEQSDMVGLNLTLDIHRTLIADLDRTPGPSPYLEAKVAAGETGMAVGQGFRAWTPEEAAATRKRLNDFLVEAARKRTQARVKA
jgi:3-hydroxybutyryl-CoA dehydrogenase